MSYSLTVKLRYQPIGNLEPESRQIKFTDLPEDGIGGAYVIAQRIRDFNSWLAADSLHSAFYVSENLASAASIEAASTEAIEETPITIVRGS